MRRSFYCLVAAAFTVTLQFFLVQSFTTTTMSLSRELKRSSVSLGAGSRRKQSRKKEKKKNQGSSGDDDTMHDNGADDGAAASLTTFGGKQQPNRRERMELILDRDGCTCVWCRTPLTIDTATTDHLLPKIKGGPSWIENELASCRTCNKKRGHTMPLEWLDECGHGDANRKAVIGLLHELDTAIQIRGGQRRVRPHLARQLKRTALLNNGDFDDKNL